MNIIYDEFFCCFRFCSAFVSLYNYNVLPVTFHKCYSDRNLVGVFCLLFILRVCSLDSGEPFKHALNFFSISIFCVCVICCVSVSSNVPVIQIKN